MSTCFSTNPPCFTKKKEEKEDDEEMFYECNDGISASHQNPHHNNVVDLGIEQPQDVWTYCSGSSMHYTGTTTQNATASTKALLLSPEEAPAASVIMLWRKDRKIKKLYADLSRVKRGINQLLNSPAGRYLEQTTDDRGLLLEGTILYDLQGVEHQLFVDIRLRAPHYPCTPCVAYVWVPEASSTIGVEDYLKEEHPLVGSRTGQLFLPYLSEWQESTHDLEGFIQAMSTCFSTNPLKTNPLPDATESVVVSISQDSNENSSHLAVSDVGNQTTTT
jgi:hypothetical protein